MNMSVALSSSGGSSNLNGAVTFTATCSPASEVTAVKFYVGNTLMATDTAAPYSFSWDTTTVAAGAYQIKATVSYSRNLQKSAILDVTVLDQQPVEASAEALASAAIQGVPVNTTVPTIRGTATQGQTIATGGGVWTNSPTFSTNQWERCDAAGANPAAISGATGGSYTLTAADVGKTIRCTVIAYNSVGAAAAVQTAQTAVVAALPTAVPVNTTLPAVFGTAVQGNKVTVGGGVWTGSPTSGTYQWKRCDAQGANPVSIAGATTYTYLLAAADVGSKVRCQVTAINASGPSTPALSSASAVVTVVPPPPVSDFTGWDPSLRPAFTPLQTIVCTSTSGFWTAWNNMRVSGGDKLDVRGVAFNGQTEFASKNLTGWSEVHFDAACTFRNTTQYFAAWVHNVSYLRFYGGDISNSGWDGMRIEQVDHFNWWGFKSHDNAGHGLGCWESATTGRTTNNVSLRGETWRNGLKYLQIDGHSEKGTGLHGCYLGSSNGWLEDFEVYLLVHDQPTGAAIENGPNTRRGKIQLDARRITFEAQSQVGGVGLSLWDGGTGPGPSQSVVVEYLYAEDCAGRAVEVSDGLAGSSTPGFTVRKARHLHTNYAITPGSVSPTNPYRPTSGSVVYQDCT